MVLLKFMQRIDTIIVESILTKTSKGFIEDLLSGGAVFYKYLDK